MVRKKWRIKTPMLVPAQWQGSVEHFYHFFHGYFVPIVLWQDKTQQRKFAVRNCGPMNPWFELLAPDTELEFLPPGVMLQRVLTHRQEYQILHNWDDPTKFHRRSLDRFVNAVLARVGAASGESLLNSLPRITVLERRPSKAFYLEAGSETHASAADWRSVPNMPAVAEALRFLGEVTLADTAGMPPAEQVRLFNSTDVLVAQHGAGLSNIVWLPKGSAVVEIKPPLMPTIGTIFSNLASIRSVDYAEVPQADEHAEIDLGAVVQQVQLLLNQSGLHVPRVTTRWPVSALRQLPRRL